MRKRMSEVMAGLAVFFLIVLLIVFTFLAMTAEAKEPRTWHRGEPVIHITKTIACHRKDAIKIATAIFKSRGLPSFHKAMKMLKDESLCSDFGGLVVITKKESRVSYEKTWLEVHQGRVPDGKTIWLFKVGGEVKRQVTPYQKKGRVWSA